MDYYHNYENQGLIPDHIRGSFERYLMHGLEPGSFVTSVLANDLIGSANRADAINITKLPHIAIWIYFNMPEGSYGSYDKVRDWIKDVNDIRTNYAEQKKKEKFWKTVTE